MKSKIFTAIVLLCFFVVGFRGAAFAAGIPKITKEELKEKLGSPDIVIIDVRVGKSWTASEVKIKNAVREDPQNADAWMNKYAKDKTLILYCS
jgi:rhodanese-related sulfurtransferase